MAKKGRPRKSPYKWNRERAEALQERLTEWQAKVGSGEAEIKYPTSRERAEAAKEYRADVMRALAANVGLLGKLNGYQHKDAPLMALAEFVNCPSREMAMELVGATNKPEKSLSAKVAEQDMEVFYNILMKHDVFVSEPSNDEFGGNC